MNAHVFTWALLYLLCMVFQNLERQIKVLSHVFYCLNARNGHVLVKKFNNPKITMKNKFNRLMLYGAVMSCIFSACSESSEDAPLAPQIEFDSEPVAVEAGAGEYKIPYTITNPDDSKVSAMSDAKWIHSVSAKVPGQISFSVYENEDVESRQGSIVVIYGNIEKTVRVSQAGKDVMSFRINVAETTQSTVKFEVSPSFIGESYLALVRTKEVFDGFKDDEALFQDDLSKFKATAAQGNISLSELLSGALATQKQVFPLSGLRPETDYVIYVYGLTADGVRTTPVGTAYFKTEDKTAASFDIKVNIDGYTANVSVASADQNLPFYSNMIDAERYAELGGKMPDAAEKELKELLNLLTGLGGLSKEDAVASLQQKSRYEYSHSLVPATRYIVFAYALSADGAVVSDVATYDFTTEASGDASALTFEFSVSDIKTDEATVSIRPSDPSCMYYSGVANSGDTAESLKARLLSLAEGGIKMGIYKDLRDFMQQRCNRGACSFTNILYQGETYRPFAVGVAEDGSFATDVIFGEAFRPKENQWSDNLKVRIDCSLYFDGDALKRLNMYLYGNYEGAAAVPCNVLVEGEAETYYFTAFYNDYGEDWTDTELHPDEEMISNIKMFGRKKGDKKLMSIRWDTPCVVCAFAVDKNGKYSNVVRTEIVCTKDQAADISKFDPDTMYK